MPLNSHPLKLKSTYLTLFLSMSNRLKSLKTKINLLDINFSLMSNRLKSLKTKNNLFYIA